MKPATKKHLFAIALMLTLTSCSGGGSSSSLAPAITDSSSGGGNTGGGSSTSTVDITNAIFTSLFADCGNYSNQYSATALDEQNSIFYTASVVITTASDNCNLTSNNIPNHDFNDSSARFATNVAEVSQNVSIPRNPVHATTKIPLIQRYYDAIMLNGVVLDLLSAGCYKPSDPQADANGNTAVGCSTDDSWLLDPLGPGDKFGADQHNAHTQNGTYHYHGNPNAMFDDSPGLQGSPVIGFAADGYPIFGSYFWDGANLRKAISGYTLKQGSRPQKDDNNPGGVYDGSYIDDYEYTSAGDLDECNGMTVDGQYGYYVTDNYPWVLNCFSGSIDASFSK